MKAPLPLSHSPVLLIAALLLCLGTGSVTGAVEKPQIEVVASFSDQQVTGVAVSKDGRVFVNFPHWSPKHTISVAEVLRDGSLKPFPDEAWNKKEGDAATRWVCVQSVHVDDSGALWVLDPASPMMEGVLPGGAKLVRFDLSQGGSTPAQTISFPEDVVPRQAYLNDVRVDTQSGHAYLTESGLGALIMVDLKTGKARRLLAGHASVLAEPNVEIKVDGIKLADPKSGQAPQIHADGIALDAKNGFLYWHALTGRTLWRAKLEDLRNESLDAEKLATAVQGIQQTPLPDGMLMGLDGAVLLTAIEENGIARFDPDSGKTLTILTNDLLQWPDSLAWGPDGWLYVTTSLIHRMPKFNPEGDKREGRPFQVLKIKLKQP